MSNRDPYSDSPEPRLVGATKAYSGVAADIVMESFTLRTRLVGEIPMLCQQPHSFRVADGPHGMVGLRRR
jgi:hypothetical protein